MSIKGKSVEVFRVFDSKRDQEHHAAILRKLSAWNTITAIVLIFLFWLYQQLFGANIINSVR